MAEILSTVSPTGTAGTPANGGARYTSMSDWENAQQGTLTTTANPAGEPSTSVLECYDFGASGLTNAPVIAGWTCNSTYYIKITAADGQGHEGKLRDGTILPVGFYVTRFASNPIIDVSVPYVRIENIGIVHTGEYAQSQQRCIHLDSAGSNFLGDSLICVFSETSSSTDGDAFYPFSINNTLRNSLFITKGGRSAIVSLAASTNFTVDNCTIIGEGLYGLWGASGTNLTSINNVAIGSDTNDFNGTYNASSSNNASGDTSAPGSSPQTGIVLTDGEDFVSPSTGDYQATSGGKLANNALDLSAEFVDDITGELR